jgi:amiloride-sensitive sodium channel
MDQGFKIPYEPYSIPIRAKKNIIMGFHLLLDPINVENVCVYRGKTFMFFLHPPNEIVTPFHDDGSVEYGLSKRVTMIVSGYYTDESLRNFPPLSRGCYFDGEKSLKYFRIYTKSHCEFECLTNFTLKTCGCVKFSMPRVAGTKVCGLPDIKCYNDIWRIWPYYVHLVDV